MRLISGALLLPLLLSGLPGCAYTSAQQQEANACQIIGPKSMIGGLAGAAGGAAIGAAAGGGKGAAIGAGVGLLAGAVIGYAADRQDCAAAQAALKSQILAARANGIIPWNSDSGHRGQYQVVGDTYAGNSGAQCRRANSLAAPGSGDAATAVVVCRQPSGDYTYATG